MSAANTGLTLNPSSATLVRKLVLIEASGGIDMGKAVYIGVDLYDSLIEHNTRLFGNERRQFLARDLVEDDLPAGPGM